MLRIATFFICLFYSTGLYSQNVEKKLEAVDDYIIEGNFDYAERLLVKILKRDDGIHEAHYRLALVFWQTDKPKKAIEEAVKAVSQKPEDANYQALLGKLWVENNQGDKALDAFETALLYDEYLPEVFLYRGDYYMETEAWSAAIADFKKLDSIVSGQPEIYFRLAHCYHALKQSQKAISYYKKALSINPLDNESRFDLAICLYEQGSYADALFHLNQLIGMVGEFADYLHQRAECYIQLDRLSEAKVDLIKARKLNPDDQRIALTTIGLEERLGNYEAALNLLDQNLARVEGMKILYVWKGRILAKKGDLKSARRNFGFAAEGFEGSADAYSKDLQVYRVLVAYLADEASWLDPKTSCDTSNVLASFLNAALLTEANENIACLGTRYQGLFNGSINDFSSTEDWMIGALGCIERNEVDAARTYLQGALEITGFEDSAYHFAEIMRLNL